MLCLLPPRIRFSAFVFITNPRQENRQPQTIVPYLKTRTVLDPETAITIQPVADHSQLTVRVSAC
ncbi:MAG: hypothetical protein CMM01_15455 [Rhodopirellula sp.]|nr:hypothetical protein [Rhodopirellula sp.]